MAPTTLTIPAGLSAGWNCVVLPPGAGLVIVPAAGVMLNGYPAPIYRTYLANIAIRVLQTAPNVFTISGN